MLRRIGSYLTTSLSIILIIVNVLSFFDDKTSALLAILNFPKLHFFLCGLLLIALIGFQINTGHRGIRKIILLFLVATTLVQGLTLKNYTPLVKPSVSTYSKGHSPLSSVKIMVANVKMTNTEFETFLQLVEAESPDILLVMETNEKWIANLDPLSKTYTERKKIALDNSYGMALYSKLKLESASVKYLSREDVPSIHAAIVLGNNKKIKFYGVHPVPPVPGKYADNFSSKEKELLMIGRIVSNDSLPSIVAGDFNDVAWSDLSTLFATSGKLKDVRTGRGFYNTFSTKSLVMRWPLDHVYVTKEFEVIALKRSEFFGSDHFAFISHLKLN